MATYDKYRIQADLLNRGWTVLRVSGKVASARSYLYKVAAKTFRLGYYPQGISIEVKKVVLPPDTFLIARKRSDR